MALRIPAPHEVADIRRTLLREDYSLPSASLPSASLSSASLSPASISSTPLPSFQERDSSTTLPSLPSFSWRSGTGGLEKAIDYSPRDLVLNPSYVTHTRYPEEISAEARRPRIIPMRQSLVGTGVMGLYDPSGHHIEINPDDRYGGMTRGFTLTHERKHAENPDRDPDPVENERKNREATYAVTGDMSQLFGFYSAPGGIARHGYRR